MKILIIGDQHTTGFGLPAGQIGFVGHFVRQISRAGQGVTAETYPKVNLTDIRTLLTQLPLEKYDLIIWQSGEGYRPVPAAPANRLSAAWQQVRRWVLTQLVGSAPVQTVPVDVSGVLQLLRPHRHKVLIMTPIPQQDGCLRRWYEQGRLQLLSQGQQQGFSVFDTARHIRPTSEYFLDQRPAFLNAVGHELIGRALFDFYQATPTIVAIRSVRKN